MFYERIDDSNHRNILGDFFQIIFFFLFFIAYTEPVFDENNPAADQHSLKLRAGSQKILVFFFSAKSHHPFNASAVVPRTVKENQFAGSR